MEEALRLVVIIPALNEAGSIGKVVGDLLNTESRVAMISKVIVVDNASEDKTSQIARQAGAEVVLEEERGYGAACLAGIQSVEDQEFDCFLFIDADGSDLATEWPILAEKLVKKNLDFVLGSRVLKKSNRGLILHQKLGNMLAALYLRSKYKIIVSDLAPYRLIKKSAFLSLDMKDRNFGWTIEMQIKAARAKLKTKEVEITNQPRVAGKSKISGTIRGTLLAAKIILSYILKDIFKGTVNAK